MTQGSVVDGVRVSIVGPTASGKSELGMRLATQYGGEILSGDSMCVYRGMDIGTAKPSVSDRALVPHHMIDVVDPDTDFSVSHFCDLGRPILDDLGVRGVPAIVVGGTGLYVDALICGLVPPPRFPEIRAELETASSDDELYARLRSLDPLAASRMESTNRRRVERALEVCLGTGEPFSSFGPGVEQAQVAETGWVRLGIEAERTDIDQRIRDRYAQQMADGFLDEVKRLDATWGEQWSRTARQGLGYRQLRDFIHGRYHSIDEAIEVASVATFTFAKRQQRWFRRNPNIVWLTRSEAQDIDLMRLVQKIRPAGPADE